MKSPLFSLEREIAPDEVQANIKFHDRLNPKVWDDDDMRLEVRIRLLRAAMAFYKFLDLPGLKLSDIVITGSNAAYNYTDKSDVDVHLIVDYERTACPDLAENFFSTKKTLWNITHEITIRGLAVEMYVEDSKHPAYSNGVYSILHGEWVKHPEAKVPSWDDAAVLRKTQHLADEIDALMDSSPSLEQIRDLMQKVWTMRQSGLASGGEFSVENLAFKTLRALGYLDRLLEARAKAQDAEISLPEARS